MHNFRLKILDFWVAQTFILTFLGTQLKSLNTKYPSQEESGFNSIKGWRVLVLSKWKPLVAIVLKLQQRKEVGTKKGILVKLLRW